MKTAFAVACALGASLLLNYAMYLQKKAVDKLPQVKFELSWPTFKAFATNVPWIISVAISMVGGGLYTVAIAMAPISIVQPIVASGVALLTYLAIKNLGEKPRRIDIYAIGLSILGVILIGVSLVEGVPTKVKHDPWELWILTGALMLVAIAVPLLLRKSTGNKQAAGLGICVGILFGNAAIFARLLLLDWTNRWPQQGPRVLFASVFVIAWAVTLFPGFVILQAALQRGMAVIVVPILAGLSQLVPILGGMVALNEPFPKNAVLTAIRIVAFMLILLGTVILSRRAEETGPAPAVALEAPAAFEEVAD